MRPGEICRSEMPQVNGCIRMAFTLALWKDSPDSFWVIQRIDLDWEKEHGSGAAENLMYYSSIEEAIDAYANKIAGYLKRYAEEGNHPKPDNPSLPTVEEMVGILNYEE